MRTLIGMDDTDNKESRGTGFKARQLAKLIEARYPGSVRGITRHQLFVHPAIAYTSQNSSACLDVTIDNPDSLKSICAEYLINEAAGGSDAGLCIAGWSQISEVVLKWGENAKSKVLILEDAISLAGSKHVYLEGFTGTKIGQIGALAAVGLRKGGNDGRFIWLRGTDELRDFDAGVFLAGDLKLKSGIDAIQTIENKDIMETDRVLCDGWTRPVLKNFQSVLLVEKVNFADYEWKTIGKDYIRSIS